MTDINELVTSYKYNIVPDFGCSCPALGLGDILFRILLMQENLSEKPFYINLYVFKSTHFYPNPYEQLKFRLDLFEDILSHHSTLSKKDIMFVDKKDFYVHQNFRFNELNRLKLDLKPSFWNDMAINNILPDEYVVFHTKLRLRSNYNYQDIKTKIGFFCSSLKSKYKVILLGEQSFPLTYEVPMHGITTCYDSLSNLTKNNQVIDMTEKDIYSHINYNSYKKDLFIIKNAKYNICFGVGGHLCSSLIFGNTVFCPIIDALEPSLFNIDGGKQIPNLDYFFDFLKTTLGCSD